MAVSVHGAEVGNPVPLFPLSLDALFYATNDYVPSADGKQFVVLQRPPEAADAEVTVIVP